MDGALASRVEVVRRFNRFYTGQIGLLQEGYLERTPRGRVVTRRALGRIDMQDRTYGWTVEM